MLFSQIGYYSLLLDLIFSFLLCFVSIKDFNNNDKRVDPNVLTLSFLQLLLVVVSFLSLIISFINSDFSNETVFNNSHTTKPLFYKISVSLKFLTEKKIIKTEKKSPKPNE